MEGERRDDPSSSSSGISPWALLVLFSIFILLFLPSFLSASFRGFRLTSVKSGWDTLNFILVVFAILCGILGRRNDESNSSPSAKSSPKNWFDNQTGRTNYLEARTESRRMRSSSSYPDLRQDAAWGAGTIADGWHCYDDTQLYRRRPDWRGSESQSFREWAGKTIPVDTVVSHRIPSPRSRSPPPSPPPPSPPPAPLPQPTAQPLPRMSAHKPLDNMVEKDEMSESGKYQPSPPPQAVHSRQRHRRGRSLEKLPEREVEGNANLAMRHRRSRTVEDLPNWELQQGWNPGVQEPHTSHSARPPPPPPPPPPLSSGLERNRKKRSGGGAKDIAAAIALFYQKKKKGSKTRRSHEDLSIYWEPSSSSSPPPPPPPPPPPLHSSVFHNLFSHKKKSKNQGIQSLSPAPPPPPPPPPSRASTRLSKKHSAPRPASSPPPPTHRSKTQAPLPPSIPTLSKKKEKLDISNFPFPPPSPLLPPPPPPPPPASYSQQLFSDSEEVVNMEKKIPEGMAANAEGAAVFCPSPDVNNKADLFIARFRAGLKLEKLNSIREKLQQKEEQQQEEIMIIGSLFDDDLI